MTVILRPAIPMQTAPLREHGISASPVPLRLPSNLRDPDQRDCCGFFVSDSPLPDDEECDDNGDTRLWLVVALTSLGELEIQLLARSRADAIQQGITAMHHRLRDLAHELAAGTVDGVKPETWVPFSLPPVDCAPMEHFDD